MTSRDLIQTTFVVIWHCDDYEDPTCPEYPLAGLILTDYEDRTDVIVSTVSYDFPITHSTVGQAMVHEFADVLHYSVLDAVSQGFTGHILTAHIIVDAHIKMPHGSTMTNIKTGFFRSKDRLRDAKFAAWYINTAVRDECFLHDGDYLTILTGYASTDHRGPSGHAENITHLDYN